ncbi:hypothetical protein VNO77_20002 [Canavalia gladiata]|uniref:Uncharacterized protein n=1 Tax=Canavalia gladiata TaxID=3824 RepID=A0AAN9LPC8_CANGL
MVADHVLEEDASFSETLDAPPNSPYFTEIFESVSPDETRTCSRPGGGGTAASMTSAGFASVEEVQVANRDNGESAICSGGARGLQRPNLRVRRFQGAAGGVASMRQMWIQEYVDDGKGEGSSSQNSTKRQKHSGSLASDVQPNTLSLVVSRLLSAPGPVFESCMHSDRLKLNYT